MSIFELVTGGTITANNPGFPEHAPTSPDQFSQDTDPSRFTIWIPTEHVTVNMGNPVFTPSGATENTSGLVQVDAGFVAQTDHHVHLHTFGDLNGTAAPGRTVVRLGTPVTVVQAVATYGSTNIKTHSPSNPTSLPLLQGTGNIESTDIGSAYPPPYNDWDGYAMVTEGGSYQESSANHIITSGNADLRLAGLRTVLLGTPGDVHIMADQDNVADVVKSANDSDATSTSTWVGYENTERVLDQFLSFVGIAWGLYTTIDAIAVLQFLRSPLEGQNGWKAASAGSFIGWAAGAIGVIGAGYALVKELVGDSPGGNVKIYASSGFTAYGATTATVHAGISTTVSSLAVTQVSSNLVTSVSSLVATSMSAMLTAVSGFFSVGLTSQGGSATVQGMSSAELSSAGKVFVAGRKDVQVNATDQDARLFLHGNGGFYLGAGPGAGNAVALGFAAITIPPGAGYGIMGSATGLLLGKMATVGGFDVKDSKKTPGPDATKQIMIQDDTIKLTLGQATVRLTSTDVYVGEGLGSGKVHLG